MRPGPVPGVPILEKKVPGRNFTAPGRSHASGRQGVDTSAGGYGILTTMGTTEAAVGRVENLQVERARRGDRRAFEELMQEHLPQVWRVVWR